MGTKQVIGYCVKAGHMYVSETNGRFVRIIELTSRPRPVNIFAARALKERYDAGHHVSARVVTVYRKERPPVVTTVTGVWQVTFDDGVVVKRCASSFEAAADVAVRVHADLRHINCDGSYMAAWRRRITRIESV